MLCAVHLSPSKAANIFSLPTYGCAQTQEGWLDFPNFFVCRLLLLPRLAQELVALAYGGSGNNSGWEERTQRSDAAAAAFNRILHEHGHSKLERSPTLRFLGATGSEGSTATERPPGRPRRHRQRPRGKGAGPSGAARTPCLSRRSPKQSKLRHRWQQHHRQLTASALGPTEARPETIAATTAWHARREMTVMPVQHQRASRKPTVSS